MEQTIRFTLNGEEVTLEVDPDRPLLWVLRSDLGLTGTKHGCNQGDCRACTVILDGRAVEACERRIGSVAGRNVITIEGLAKGDALHPIQQAFMEHDALQCGYCTPGMIMAAYRLLQSNPQPTEADITQALNRNFCRCGAHKRIIAAVQDAAQTMRA